MPEELVMDAPQAEFTPPTAPDIPSATPEADRERKARLPRLNPPEGGWKEFPVPEFDPEKYSSPVKKDFNETGPYYEQYRLSKIQEEIDALAKSKTEMEAEVKLWKECDNDKEQVDLRRAELRTKNRLMDFVANKKFTPEELKALIEAAQEAGVQVSA